MAAHKLLTPVTLADIEAKGRAGLRQGLLKAGLNPGPDRSKAGFQPPDSGSHFSSQAPVLVQYPAEVLVTIMGYLEPIWLFQVAAAYTEINAFLSSPGANKIFYNVLPPSLYLEPEHFQDEDKVEELATMFGSSLNDSWLQPLSVPSYDRRRDMPNERYFWPAVGSQNGFFALPHIPNMSILSTRAEFSCGISHPEDQLNYPFLPVRYRVLAIGGPFHFFLDYRAELAGHLHHGRRCYFCLEIVSRSLRPSQLFFSLLLCMNCLRKNTLTPQQIQRIAGLDKLIQADRDDVNSIWAARHRPADHLQWKFMVDAVLQKEVGLTYDTAVAAQQYIDQLLKTWAISKRGNLEESRRELRHKLVANAQKMWEQGTSSRDINTQIEKYKVFCSTNDLPQFLFPARSLEESKMYLPYDSNETWLPDPTMTLGSSRAISNVNIYWIEGYAQGMLENLTQSHKPGYNHQGRGGAVTAWVNAAMQYHMKRIELTVTVDHVMGKIVRDTKLHPLGVSGYEWRLEVVLQKLGIYRGVYRDLQQLGRHELDLAVRAFRKIVLEAITICPESALLALPRGLEGVLNHFRQFHSRRFWNDEWSIIG